MMIDHHIVDVLVLEVEEEDEVKNKTNKNDIHHVNLTSYDHGTALKLSRRRKFAVTYHLTSSPGRVCIPQSRLDPREEFYNKTYAGRFGPYISEISSTTSGN